MKILRIAVLAAAGLMMAQAANAGEAEYAEMVAAHARANGVPEALVHRVIMRESRYQPGLVGRGGTIGLMQIKLATARGVGYTGDAAGLRDPNTNLTYAVKYLAGAYHAANGDHARAVRYFAGGYYYVAKRQRQEQMVQQASADTWLEPNGNPQPMFGTAPHRKLAQRVRNARAQVSH
ncbi:lytic transglycosylase domain-containing protein [Bradyrhizobium sp. CCGB01]|uniref:lytic transglycosylase domain-containing protein n=1 Tax=Bradyrhizobium sp. CCGB01 TaxID=2949634 RepID=UPI0020B19EBE|nr:lytic transglycosylase domain-containing protein [Bradyrhizobium sp. CCGB01]MCP3410896.1 lytic transglycosylase domain-containing protein [Bradyrhizobium sp. CCGB01]